MRGGDVTRRSRFGLACLFAFVGVWLCGVCTSLESAAIVGVELPSAETGADSLPVGAVDMFDDRELTRFAFGSCNAHDMTQPVWGPLTEFAPSAFAWLGDIVYADTRVRAGMFAPSAPDVVRERFAAQSANPGYRGFRDATNATILGVYDDHDYNCNDGGAECGTGPDAQDALLDFLQVPHGSPRRARAGAYSAALLGAPGRRLLVVLLDARTHRDARYGNDPATRDMLGAAQWAWLEAMLDGPHAADAQAVVIGSGVQVVAADKPPLGVEGWYYFPAARRRLFDLIARVSAKRAVPVLVLSGDVHYAELARVSHCDNGSVASASGAKPASPADAAIALCMPVHDVTSSGLTHAFGNEMLRADWASALFDTFVPSPSRVGPALLERNFGTIEFDWPARRLTVAIRSVLGPVLATHRWTFAELTASAGACARCAPDVPIWRMMPFQPAQILLVIRALLGVAVVVVFWRISRRCWGRAVIR